MGLRGLASRSRRQQSKPISRDGSRISLLSLSTVKGTALGQKITDKKFSNMWCEIRVGIWLSSSLLGLNHGVHRLSASSERPGRVWVGFGRYEEEGRVNLPEKASRDTRSGVPWCSISCRSPGLEGASMAKTAKYVTGRMTLEAVNSPRRRECLVLVAATDPRVRNRMLRHRNRVIPATIAGTRRSLSAFSHSPLIR